MKNVTIGEVFECVSKKTGYDFFYNNQKLNAYKRVNVRLRNADLPALFRVLFPDTLTRYEVVNKCILITGFESCGLPPASLVEGVVMDESGACLADVNIGLSGESREGGTISDRSGRFTLRIAGARNKELCFSHVGYQKYVYRLRGDHELLQVVLKESVTELNECVITGYDEQMRLSVVGAVADVGFRNFVMPAGSVSNYLGGRVGGIISLTRSGEPGNDFSEFWIRGISTFGAGQKALVLIDGVEGDINELDTEEIERLSVLKDASSTALFGVRGANGVIAVETRRGKAGPTKVDVSSSVVFSHSPLMPRYVGGAEYARMANEASIVRGGKMMFTPVELELIDGKLDEDFYPDVDWQKEVLKSHAWNHQHRIGISGGNQIVRYFVSGGITSKSALYNTQKNIGYDPNVNWRRYAARGNMDFSLARNSILSLSLNTIFTKQIKPGYQHRNAIWQAISKMNPLAIPIRYSDGSLPGLGLNEYETSPYVLLNYTGYSEDKSNSYRFDLSFTQKFVFGENNLSIQAFASLKSLVADSHYRLRHPETYKAERREENGKLTKKLLHEARNFNYSDNASDAILYYGALMLKYQREWSGGHHLNGLLHYYMQEEKKSYHNLEYKWEDLLPVRYQAVAVRLMYDWQRCYFVEFNGGYTGSDNFPVGKKFNFFPSVGIGVVLTDPHSLGISADWLDFLKVRISWGKVGNDRIEGLRFPYLDRVGSKDVPTAWGPDGLSETYVGARDIRWEMNEKYNIGVDFRLWEGMIKGNLDLYRNRMEGIFQQRVSMPQEVGIAVAPYMNIGCMVSRGIDAEIKFSRMLGSRVSLDVTGNLTYTENRIRYWEGKSNQLEYQAQSNYPYRINRGLISLGLFADSSDILCSPRQTFGEVRPGDIKYRDVNGDGRIDDKDIVPLKGSDIPRMLYGISSEIGYGNWSFGIFLTGVSKVSTFYGGEGVYPFAGKDQGNVLALAWEDRWTPAWYSGSRDTENPNALFPRLTYGASANNNRPSTFWLKNTSYLRLKMVEAGYSFKTVFRGLEELNISFLGENLFLWSRQKAWGWDPEQLSPNGSVYPIQRRYSLRLRLMF